MSCSTWQRRDVEHKAVSCRQPFVVELEDATIARRSRSWWTGAVLWMRGSSCSASLANMPTEILEMIVERAATVQDIACLHDVWRRMRVVVCNRFAEWMTQWRADSAWGLYSGRLALFLSAFSHGR
jgi:hypothetical protein